jgi:hypothetical protein
MSVVVDTLFVSMGILYEIIRKGAVRVDEPEQLHVGPLPGDDPDPEWTSYEAWRDAEIAAGRYGGEPEIREPDEVFDPETGLRFGQRDEADLLPPGTLLAVLTEAALCRLPAMSDDELTGVLLAARRQQVREQYKEVLVTAEFARRREAAFEDAKDRGVPVGCRPGGFPGEELAMELAVTRAEAAHLIQDALDLTARLPATLAGMAAGLIDETRAGYIAYYTRSLSTADAAHADEVLAAVAPDLRTEQLARKAAALEMKLAPEAVKARKEHERRVNQRVEARREYSGNACLSAREMDTADAIASKAYIDAVAARLRNGGLAAPLGALRVLALADLTQGRNPLDRLSPAANIPGYAGPAERPGPGYAGPDGWPGWDEDEAETARYHDPLADELEDTRRGPVRTCDPVPLPALINLLVPADTIFGQGSACAQTGTWGLLDRDETRALVKAASRHPRTRWCITVTNEKGEAVAHACARGQQPGLLGNLGPQPPPPTDLGLQSPRADLGSRQPAAHLGELLRRLGITAAALQPIVTGGCDHTHAEDRYVPSRTLRHLVRARTATCDAPGCDNPAVHADLDHTVPHPDGLTCQCNLGPKCRTHHRAKQAPDWKVEQPEPGVIRWTLPSGRVHTTAPTRYEL